MRKPLNRRYAALDRLGEDIHPAGDATDPLVNYPATDHPDEISYQSLLSQAVE